MSPCENIVENLKNVKQRIKAAASRFQTPRIGKIGSRESHLIVVTKTRPAEWLACLLAHGHVHFGENYVQEAMKKDQIIKERYSDIPSPIWELIGPLQRKKVRKALQLFWRIHTLDRESLAKKISTVAQELGRQSVPTLIQVNIDGTKNGIEPDEVVGFVEAIKTFPRLDLQGLMCIAPISPEKAIRESFIKLRELRDQVREEHPELRESFVHLSMGMTNDFEMAIEEGSTIVRIGRAIFSDL